MDFEKIAVEAKELGISSALVEAKSKGSVIGSAQYPMPQSSEEIGSLFEESDLVSIFNYGWKLKCIAHLRGPAEKAKREADKAKIAAMGDAITKIANALKEKFSAGLIDEESAREMLSTALSCKPDSELIDSFLELSTEDSE